MIKLFAIIGLGGAIGSVLRYYTAVLFLKFNHAAFPYATLTVNIMGCFFIGLLFSASVRYQWFSVNWRLFLITGFCGGFTTFSTFAFENVLFLQEGHYRYFLLYAIGSYAAGLLAVVAGINIIKFI